MKKSSIFYTSSVCAIFLAACGGGGGSSSSSTPTPPPTATNQPPNAVASAENARIVEGRQIVLSASSSTDADGDALTFSWEQISGPTAVISGSASAVEITAAAPDVDAETILTFEVSVSDGVASSTNSVSVTVDPLSFEISELLPFLIVQSAPNNYTIFTDADEVGLFNFGSQEFSSNGEAIGAFISGSLSPENSDENVSLTLEDVVQSGDITYNGFSSTFSDQPFGAPQEVRLSTVRGRIDQNFQTLGDQYASFAATAFLAHDAIAIGDEQLATIGIIPSSGAGRDIAAHIVNLDGSLEASASLGVEERFAIASTIARFDTNTVAGFWIANNLLNMQIMNIDGTLVGENVGLSPIQGDFFNTTSPTSIANNEIMVLTEEGQNFSPTIALRVFNDLGELVVPPTGVGIGVEPQAITLNDGNVLVVWDGLEDGVLARIVSPSGTFISDTHILSPERLLFSYPPFQLDDGVIVMGRGNLILRFPIEDIDLFPVLVQ